MNLSALKFTGTKFTAPHPTGYLQEASIIDQDRLDRYKSKMIQEGFGGMVFEFNDILQKYTTKDKVYRARVEVAKQRTQHSDNYYKFINLHNS